MKYDQLTNLLASLPSSSGYRYATVFFGALSENTAAALDKAARQGAVIFYVYDGPEKQRDYLNTAAFFHFSGDKPEILSENLKTVFDKLNLTEGFQISSKCECGFESLRDRITPLLLKELSNVKIDRITGLTHLRCTLHNLRAIISKPRLSLSASPETKVVVCSAGPSLRDQTDQLQKYRSNYFLICVGHALPILDAAGISPDLIVEIDSDSARNWNHSIEPECPLAALPITAPEVVNRFEKFIWFSEPKQERREFIESLGIKFPSITVARSVVVTAVAIALEAGFKHIALTGNDLCLSSSGTVHENNDSTLEKVFEVPGNDSATVKTIQQLHGIQESLENFLSHHPNKICNCTIGGVKLAYSRRMSLTDFLAQSDAPPEVSFKEESIPYGALEKLQQCWGEYISGYSSNEISNYITKVVNDFARCRSGKLVKPLISEITDDITGNSINAHYSECFRNYALDFIRKNNPKYADWLTTYNSGPLPEKLSIASWGTSIPLVRTKPENLSLSPGFNREHAAYEAVKKFCSESGFNPASDVMVFIAPGDWIYPVEFAKIYPNTPVIAIDPYPELFASLIGYSCFLDVLPESTVVIGVHNDLKRWQRTQHAAIRDIKRAGKRIIQFIHPILKDFPEVKKILKNLPE